MAADEKQDVCPICAEPFKFKQVVVKYSRWQHDDKELNAHVDCLLYYSADEDGRMQHPPLARLLRQK